MGITITGKSGEKYPFEGPYSNTDSLEDGSGVYAIFVRKIWLMLGNPQK